MDEWSVLLYTLVFLISNVCATRIHSGRRINSRFLMEDWARELIVTKFSLVQSPFIDSCD